MLRPPTDLRMLPGWWLSPEVQGLHAVELHPNMALGPENGSFLCTTRPLELFGACLACLSMAVDQSLGVWSHLGPGGNVHLQQCNSH
jgi:hypothetical protein